jgi:hypothetical protein
MTRHGPMFAATQHRWVALSLVAEMRPFLLHGEATFKARMMSPRPMNTMPRPSRLAAWVGFQRATTHMRGRTEAVPFNLRVTEVSRREGDEWKLIHRHADPLTAEAKEQKK